MAAAKNIVKVLSAAVRVNEVRDGKPTHRQIGYGEDAKPILERITKLVFLSRGDALPEYIADGEQERLEADDVLGTKEEVARFGDGRVAPAPEPAPVEEVAPPFDATSASDQELVDHITEAKPNVADTVAMAGADAALAERILAAEKAATDNDARSGVEKGLNAIIEAAKADE